MISTLGYESYVPYYVKEMKNVSRYVDSRLQQELGRIILFCVRQLNGVAHKNLVLQAAYVVPLAFDTLMKCHPVIQELVNLKF